LTPLGFSQLKSRRNVGRLCKLTTCSKQLVCYEALVSAMQQRAELAECFRVIEQHAKSKLRDVTGLGETDSASEVCHDCFRSRMIRYVQQL